MMEQEFTLKLDRSLNISDVTTLADSTMGVTTGYNNTINIELNENKLPSKSQEYILATVYHEIIQGYMAVTLPKDSNGKFIIPNNHETMATNYVLIITGALKVAYPNLGDTEAWALAWGGMENTNLFNSSILTDAQRTQIKDINNRHQKNPPSGSSLGSFCN